METIGKRLKRLRLQKELSVAKIASHLGVSESTYRDWEHGRSIQGEPYVKLAEVLGVGAFELITGEPSDRAWIIAELDQLDAVIKRLRLAV